MQRNNSSKNNNNNIGIIVIVIIFKAHRHKAVGVKTILLLFPSCFDTVWFGDRKGIWDPILKTA